MAKWMIFNFYDGDFIRQDNVIVRFETKGLAYQFLEQYQKPRPIKKTKDFTVNYSYYDAPFRFVKEKGYEAI